MVNKYLVNSPKVEVFRFNYKISNSPITKTNFSLTTNFSSNSNKSLNNCIFFSLTS